MKRGARLGDYTVEMVRDYISHLYALLNIKRYPVARQDQHSMGNGGNDGTPGVQHEIDALYSIDTAHADGDDILFGGAGNDIKGVGSLVAGKLIVARLSEQYVITFATC